MYSPPISLFREVVSPSIREATAEPIKHSSTPATVYRVRLKLDKEGSEAHLIVKRVEPGWPDDPHGHEREARFFADLWPCLGLVQPNVYYAGVEPDTAYHIVVMDDLAATHRFPPPTHAWTQAENRQILRAYARLHARGRFCLPPDGQRAWLMARHEERVLDKADELPDMVEALVARCIWRPMPCFQALLRRTLPAVKHYKGYPATLLHNDVYPPNIALPEMQSGEAALVDWDMLGWGLAEMDLAFMFLQPFGSHRRLDRQEALEFYWRQREKLEGRRDSTVERRARQAYADALWTLWLIPVAHSMALSPYPPGSPVRVYWDSMFPVLGERLRTLCHE